MTICREFVSATEYGLALITETKIRTPEYGSLAPLVKTVGWLVSATGTIIWSFRRRSKWEPSEEDVSNGPNRVAGLLTAVGIAIIWTQLANSEHISMLGYLATIFAVGTLGFLLLYGFLIGADVYKIEIATGLNQVESKNIIGGIALRASAKTKLAEALTVQKSVAWCRVRS